MADNTKIEWCDATWNALRGCSRVSAGCANCYAENMAARFSNPGQWGHEIAVRGKGWTGKVVLDEKALMKPLHWRKPRRIFVTSIGDPFHPAVTDAMLDRLFAVMALCQQHTFQLLTKHPERMRDYLDGIRIGRTRSGRLGRAFDPQADISGLGPNHNMIVEGGRMWPFNNLWIGVSVENQATADKRIPHLLMTPAAVRFLSCEPLVGPVDLTAIPWTEGGGTHLNILGGRHYHAVNGWWSPGQQVDWVIVGGESGPKARPMHPDWARSLRDQCAVAGIPFMFKQWGEWTPGENVERQHGMVKTAFLDNDEEDCVEWFFSEENLASTDGHIDDQPDLYRVGKSAAGRLLDGRDHNEVPGPMRVVYEPYPGAFDRDA